MPDTKNFVTISELSKQINLTKAQIKHAIKRKTIPLPKKHGFSKLSPYVFTSTQVQQIKSQLYQSNHYELTPSK